MYVLYVSMLVLVMLEIHYVFPFLLQFNFVFIYRWGSFIGQTYKTERILWR